MLAEAHDAYNLHHIVVRHADKDLIRINNGRGMGDILQSGGVVKTGMVKISHHGIHLFYRAKMFQPRRTLVERLVAEIAQDTVATSGIRHHQPIENEESLVVAHQDYAARVASPFAVTFEHEQLNIVGSQNANVESSGEHPDEIEEAAAIGQEPQTHKHDDRLQHHEAENTARHLIEFHPTLENHRGENQLAGEHGGIGQINGQGNLLNEEWRDDFTSPRQKRRKNQIQHSKIAQQRQGLCYYIIS